MADLIPDEEYFAGDNSEVPSDSMGSLDAASKEGAKAGYNKLRRNSQFFRANPNEESKDPKDNAKDQLKAGYTNGIKKAQSHHIFKLDPDSSKEHEFLEENQKGWIHGLHTPHVVFKYESNKVGKDSFIQDKSRDERMFVPKASFEEASNGSIQTGLTSDSSGSMDQADHDDVTSSVFNNESTTSSFSGYYSLPSNAINFPPSIRATINLNASPDLGHICYQNHHDINDWTFTFGGLFTNQLINFKLLGLPKDVDPDRISIEFNCELPPHVDREMIASPYLIQNNSLYLLNSIRSTISFLEPTFNFGETPTSINAMMSSQVSYRHVFFYGGFSIDTLSTYYDPTINRWIVKKTINMNEDGYILDVSTFRFTKISLKPKEGQPKIDLGRIGASVTSNIYHREESNADLPDRIPSPPIFSEGVDLKPKHSNHTYHSPQTPGSPLTIKQTNLNAKSSSQTQLNAPIPSKSVRADGLKLPSSPAKQKSISSMATRVDHSSNASNNSESNNSNMNPSSLASSASSFLIKGTNKVVRSGTNLSNNSASTNATSNSRVPPVLANLKNSPSSSSSSSTSSSPSSGPGSKMSNVLSKSSRIFHRNHQRQPSSNNRGQNKTNDANKETNNVTPHPLKNTYSKDMKQRRSNSNSSHHMQQPTSAIANEAPISRSGSSTRNNPPPPPPPPAVPNSSNTYHKSRLSGGSPLSDNYSKNDNLPNETLDFKPLLGPKPFYANQQYAPTALRTNHLNSGGSHSANTSVVNSPTALNASVSAVGDPTSIHLNDTANHEIPNEQSSFAESNESNLRNPLFGESIQRNGIQCISVFVFGGFTCHLDPKDPHAKVFKASSDLLKIELIIQEDSINSLFFEDAIVYLIGNEETCKSRELLVQNGASKTENEFFWPSLRGYFASAIIDFNSNLERNCQLFNGKLNELNAFDNGSGHNDSTENSTLRAESGSFSDNFSTSDQSNSKSSFVSGIGLSGSITRPRTHGNFFDGKALFVQGGVDDKGIPKSDFNVFSFDNGKWYPFQTYMFNYFDNHIQPYEDDDGTSFSCDREVADPKLVEAELRACHHSSLFYQNEENDYLIFLGGFYNDYLRFFDKEPYTSDKYDVSRLSKLQFQTNNPTLSRIAILNLKTQTWRFMKYFCDMKHFFKEKELYKVHNNPSWINARISNYGGAISLNGKMVTLCHGLVKVVPEKREDYDRLQQEFSYGPIMWGAHVHFTFPSL